MPKIAKLTKAHRSLLLGSAALIALDEAREQAADAADVTETDVDVALAADDERSVGEVGTLDPLDERVLQLLGELAHARRRTDHGHAVDVQVVLGDVVVEEADRLEAVTAASEQVGDELSPGLAGADAASDAADAPVELVSADVATTDGESTTTDGDAATTTTIVASEAPQAGAGGLSPEIGRPIEAIWTRNWCMRPVSGESSTRAATALADRVR